MDLINKVSINDFPVEVREFLGDNQWTVTNPTLVFSVTGKRGNIRTLFDVNGVQYFVASDFKQIGIDVRAIIRTRDNSTCHYKEGFHWNYSGNIIVSIRHNLSKDAILLTKEGLIQIIDRSHKPELKPLQMYIQRWFALMSYAIDKARERITRESIEDEVRRKILSEKDETVIRLQEMELMAMKAAEESRQREEALRLKDEEIKKMKAELERVSSSLKNYVTEQEKLPLKLITISNTKLYLFAACNRKDDGSPFIKVGITKQIGSQRLTQVRKDIKNKYKVDCDLTKLCEFECYSADAAERLCHKLLEPIHIEDEYFQPYIKYILYCMKRACYIVNNECKLTNDYIIPYIYTSGEMVDDLYAFMDQRKEDEILCMNIEESLEQVKISLKELLSLDDNTLNAMVDSPKLIAMSEEDIEIYKQQAVKDHKRDIEDRTKQILIDAGCTIIEANGVLLISRQHCINSLNIPKTRLPIEYTYNLHDIRSDYRYNSVGYPLPNVIKTILSTKNTDLTDKFGKLLIDDILVNEEDEEDEVNSTNHKHINVDEHVIKNADILEHNSKESLC